MYVTNHHRNASKSHNETCLIPARKTIIKKEDKHFQGYKEMGTLFTVGETINWCNYKKQYANS